MRILFQILHKIFPLALPIGMAAAFFGFIVVSYISPVGVNYFSIFLYLPALISILLMPFPAIYEKVTNKKYFGSSIFDRENILNEIAMDGDKFDFQIVLLKLSNVILRFLIGYFFIIPFLFVYIFLRA
jgi:hypothetical protein